MKKTIFSLLIVLGFLFLSTSSVNALSQGGICGFSDCGTGQTLYNCGKACEDQFCNSNPCLQCCEVKYSGIETVACGDQGGVCLPLCDTAQTSCSVSSPPTSPPSTPIPTQPGTWGSCGGCSPCGGPSNECVEDPNGVCLWDPSGCGTQGKSATCNLCFSQNDYSGSNDPWGACNSDPGVAYQDNRGRTKYADIGVQYGAITDLYVYSKNNNGHLYYNEQNDWVDDPNTSIGGNGNCNYSYIFNINGVGGSGKKANCPGPFVVREKDGTGCTYLNQTSSNKKNGGVWICDFRVTVNKPQTRNKLYNLFNYNYTQAKNQSLNDGDCGANVSTMVFAGTAPQPTPTAPPVIGSAWWQAINGDVSSGGDLTSQVPAGDQFIIPPSLTGFPGVASYTGSYDFTADGGSTGSPSSLGWLAKSTYLGKTYDSNFFNTNLSTSTVYNTLSNTADGATAFSGGNVSPDGYFWYTVDGNLIISNNTVITGTRKVVVLVNGGNVILGGNITIQNPGQGTFILIANKDISSVGGNIAISGSVTTLNGIFLADGFIADGVSSSQLAVTGSLVAHGGLNLQRDLGGVTNATTPAEKFTFDPRLMFTLPKSLGVSRIVWKEVAP